MSRQIDNVHAEVGRKLLRNIGPRAAVHAPAVDQQQRFAAADTFNMQAHVTLR
jgi:hypothetical protein